MESKQKIMPFLVLLAITQAALIIGKVPDPFAIFYVRFKCSSVNSDEQANINVFLFGNLGKVQLLVE